jgi:hypothetical protein
VNSLGKEQRLFIVAGGFGLFIISLFLKYAGQAKGFDVLPSGWLWLLAAAIAGGVCIANAMNIELPDFVDNTLALIIGAGILFIMVAILFDGDFSKKFGFFVGLIGAIVGFGGLLLTRSDRV